MKDPIRILTRDSFLALAQTLRISRLYNENGYKVDVIAQKTSGDIKLDAPLYEISKNAATEKEGKAFFTKELEDGLLSSQGDLAVHSLKDLPTDLPPGLSLATPALEEVSTDTIVSSSPLPEDLKEQLEKINSLRVGTSSLRRIALLKEYFPEAEVVPVRGNLLTRMKKLLAGDTMDVLILATAGLKRLYQFYDYWNSTRSEWVEKLDPSVVEKLDDEYNRLTEIKKSELYFYEIDTNVFYPAVCQGILGIETQENDVPFFSKLHNENETLKNRVELERKILTALEAGCHIPLGITVQSENGYWNVELYFADGFSPDTPYTKNAYRANRKFILDNYEEKLDNFIAEIKGTKYPVIYCGKQNLEFQEILEKNNYEVSHYPLIQTDPTGEPICFEENYDAAIVVSKSAVDYLPAYLPLVKSWIATGDKTAAHFEKKYSNLSIDFPETFSGLEAAKLALETYGAKKILWIAAKEGNREGIEYLQEQGCEVEIKHIYQTSFLTFTEHHPDQAEKEKVISKTAWWVFSSPSSVKAYLDQNLHRPNHLISVIGNTTESMLLENDIIPYHKASSSNLETLANEITGRKKITSWKTKQWSLT
ncbi:MAG: uroporphyrinogen-III synthase [Leptospirales bacterium]